MFEIIVYFILPVIATNLIISFFMRLLFPFNEIAEMTNSSEIDFPISDTEKIKISKYKIGKEEFKVTSHFVGKKNIQESILKLAETKALKKMGLKK